MLTKSEREWLEERRWCRFLFQCEECPEYDPMRILPDKVEVPCKRFSHCATYTNNYDLADAAEFSERVAAKLANPQWAVCWNSDSCLEFDGSKDEPRWWWDCEWCRLKHARLQVEEEMDNANK